jgi:hypothetical protein
VHEHREVAELEQQELPAPPHARERAPLQRVQRGVEALQRVDAGRQDGLDDLPLQRGPEPAGDDLHLRQLGHASTLE